MWNATPLVALDVYEHAYFLDYQTDRGPYIDAFLNNLDWDGERLGLEVPDPGEVALPEARPNGAARHRLRTARVAGLPRPEDAARNDPRLRAHGAEGGALNAQAERFLALIASASRQMEELIAEFSAAARVEAGRLAAEPEAGRYAGARETGGGRVDAMRAP